MAEQLREGMSEEYDKDTDVKNAIHCDPCKDEGIQVKASGFCVDCNDYLCIACCQIHKRARPLRNHVLTNAETIQKKSDATTQRKPEQCQEHQKEAINWYCKSHDKCICDICKQGDHRNCTDIKSVTDVSQHYLSSDKLKQVTDRLIHLQTEFGGSLSTVTNNTCEINRQYAAVKDDVARTISMIRNKDLERMQSLTVTCDTTVKTISSILNEIKTLKPTGEADSAFFAARKFESQVQVFNERLASVVNDNKITKYTYASEPGNTAEGIIGKIFAMKDGRALNVDDINVKTSTDTSACWISGIERLSDNRLVIADRNNTKIKLVDLTSKAIIELKLDEAPFDLTSIDDKTIAVTTSNGIHCVSISDTLKIKTVMQNGNAFKGIVCSNNKLIVSYHTNRNRIQIMNFDGTDKKIKDLNTFDTDRLNGVNYITQGPDSNILYSFCLTTRVNRVISYYSGKVSSMTLDGQVISSFTRDNSFKGITVGENGRIFVCSNNTNEIFEISSDLSEGQVILDGKDGITQPWSILYDGHNNLFVGSKQKNSIKVFLV